MNSYLIKASCTCLVPISSLVFNSAPFKDNYKLKRGITKKYYFQNNVPCLTDVTCHDKQVVLIPLITFHSSNLDKYIYFRIMSLVSQMCLVKISKYIKLQIDTVNTFWVRIKFWHDNDNLAIIIARLFLWNRQGNKSLFR